MFTTNNLLLKTDSYKVSHHTQFPEGTDYTYYYGESRGGKYPEVMVAGLQYLAHLFAQGISKEDVEEANSLYQAHFGRNIFNYEGFMRIVEELDGVLPLHLVGLPEGTVVPTSMPIYALYPTEPGYGWLPGYFETVALRAVWYPTTVATESFKAKEHIYEWLQKTTEDEVIPQVLPFRLHDFGARGCSSGETAAIGGTAHLMNFMGTDTVEALYLCSKLYEEEMAGFSIPAREHSTTTIYLEDFEDEAFLNSIDQWGEGLYACVMDSYDYSAALQRITTGTIRDKIIASGGTFVIRPDSGNPVDVVIEALETVAKNVGYTVNSKGYKVLHPSYRVIQGDGIDTEEVARILSWMATKGFSAENVAFGMGGGLLQHMDRDTQRFAMKCSFAVISGEGRDVFKMPKTDPSKASKKGEVATCRNSETGEFQVGSIDDYDCAFINYYRGSAEGMVVTKYNFANVREVANERFK